VGVCGVLLASFYLRRSYQFWGQHGMDFVWHSRKTHIGIIILKENRMNEPFIGEIRKGKDIGKNPDYRYIWQACSNCGSVRWVAIVKNEPRSLLCRKCSSSGQKKVSVDRGVPQIGEIRRGRDIGKKPAAGNFIWAACSKCGVPRWVMLKKGEPESLICDGCSRLARRKVNPNKGAPQIGETRMGREIGRKPDNTGFIYRACPDCGKLDWVQVNKGKPANLRCKECKGLAQRKSTTPYTGSPQLGEIRMGWEIGKSPEHSFIWRACPDCGLTSWAMLKNGKPVDLRCKECAGLARRGENNVRWLGGKSFEPYTTEFNNDLREQIRKRDNYTCQLCGKPQGKYKLAVHHINYIKEDCRPKNLVSLCGRNKGEINCHALTNHDRSSWIAFFTDLMERRFPTVTESCVNLPNKDGESNVEIN